MCREFAGRYVEAHKRDFKRLGVFGQWDKPYLTMDPEHEATIAGAFIDFSREGIRVSRAEAGLLVHLRPHRAGGSGSGVRRPHQPFHLGEVSGCAGDKCEVARSWARDVNALIWTTTPWTLPANRALAFHPDFEYVVAETPAGKLLLAKERVSAFAEELKTRNWQRRRLAGKAANSKACKFQHPFLDMQRAGRAGGLRDARSGQRNRPHRAGPWRGRLPHRPEIWPRNLRAAG